MDHSQGVAAGLLLAGRYRLGESIGSGGMGRVWRAHDEVLHRTVAVKELTAGLYVAEADRVILHARAQKEARAAARINHPGVVTVHDVLEHDNRPWIVMEYVDGPSLADAAKESGPMAPAEAARVGLHVLGALRAAHAAGVLHRDVKPGNVLLAKDGRVLLTDFGIAAIEGDATITRTGELIGSIDYLAPERVRGGDPGPASDLWALGATLYTAVEERSPFRRTSPISTLQAVVAEEPLPTRHAGALGPVITALLRKEPEDRPSVAEAERMLLDAMEGREPRAAQAYVPTQRVTQGDLRETNTAKSPPVLPPVATTPFAPVPAAAPAGRFGGWRTAVVAVLAAALVGGGAAFGVVKYADGEQASDAAGGAGSVAPEADPDPDAVPKGWQRVQDPAGFSLLVPNGWKRQMDGTEIDYTPDNGAHRIRISIDHSPDFENPYMHMLALEKTLKAQLPKYRRVALHTNHFRDGVAGLWEFGWTAFKEHPGERRAIDQMYFADNGRTEYAIYMSGPEKDWATTREQFDTVLRGWRPPAGQDD
ncbi:serine/threonine-protein kinase [Streptomyces sp. H27-C3]|uniref:serine/threonine-protein kinase n=1 Tax=Streptomyces sp. H27-C3 TaxID=3046305 RepID=UPI0024B930AE|nr:serine/threonine-protein kinase [Streptomyces sp. H27-C3]MDJ0466474.1 serine/threonine-protein kinase [Streptomyces sp. H27-C3]